MLKFVRSGQQQLCKIHGYGLLCDKYPSSAVHAIPAFPIFADYFVDEHGKQWERSNEEINPMTRPISTDWFKPQSSLCVTNPVFPNVPCANLGDELGGLLLSWLYVGVPIEKRSITSLDSRYNTTVWGAGTKWGVKGVCFDFRAAVRGSLTRKVFLQHGCNIPDVYGDPALLLPYLYDPRSYIWADPNINVFIIPHIDDFSSPERFEWWAKMNGTKDISSRFFSSGSVEKLLAFYFEVIQMV
ncbi:hypothetical protein ACHAWF_002015 [Thalassiosira exigua]